jgi:uncharacterized membrane protein
MRRASIILLWVYGGLSGILVAGGYAGYTYPHWVTILMTILAFAFALVHGSQCLGWRLILILLALTFVVSLVFESVGVATGLIYGPYHYTSHLGPMFLGLMPYVIPLAWFMMMYPALIIGLRLAPSGWSARWWGLAVAAIGALAMTAWDLAMDPHMVYARHWEWDTPGAFFGIPLQNYGGWWVTCFVALGLFLIFSRSNAALRSTADKLSTANGAFERLAVYSYAVTGTSSVLVDINLGLYGPALAGFFAMLPWVLGGLIISPDKSQIE